MPYLGGRITVTNGTTRWRVAFRIKIFKAALIIGHKYDTKDEIYDPVAGSL